MDGCYRFRISVHFLLNLPHAEEFIVNFQSKNPRINLAKRTNIRLRIHLFKLECLPARSCRLGTCSTWANPRTDPISPVLGHREGRI